MDANLELDALGAGPLLAQANLARIRSHWNEAVEICVRVLRSQPGNADAHSLLGDIYRDQGLVDDAIQWYRMASDLRPTGPDVEKLRKLEVERDRQAALSVPLNAAMAEGGYDGGAGGTTQLMGYSPKRWLNTLTIVSACFLAAIVLVLGVMRFNMSSRGNGARQVDFSSRPTMMPTAETGMALPRVDPNRPTILPLGEQPKPQTKVHQTGDGLEPDHPNNSLPNSTQPATSARPAPLPPFAPQGRNVTNAQYRAARQNTELPPAPVRMVQPLNASLGVAGDGAQPARERQPGGQELPRTPGAEGQGSVERDPSVEREPARGLGATKPAQDTRAGEQSTGNGGTPLER